MTPSNDGAKSALTKSATNGTNSDPSQLKNKGVTHSEEKRITLMREFIWKQAQAAKARGASETMQPPEYALVNDTKEQLGDEIKEKLVSLEKLGVELQTVFISPRTVDVNARADLRRLRPYLSSGTGTPSRRTSMASRSQRDDNQLEEIRQKLNEFTPHVQPTQRLTVPEESAPRSTSSKEDLAVSPSESNISSSLDLIHKVGKKRVDGKGAPAVAAINATAMGTTSNVIHEESISGWTTPTANAPGTPRTSMAAYKQYGSSYEGHDPSVRAFLEMIDLENYREPLLDFGPRVVSNQRRRNQRTKNNTNQPITLIAHLTQHTAPIISIITSPDNLFFATASEDKKILIWDSARLERSVSTNARLNYTCDGPVSAMSRLENTHCLAVASEDGSVVVLRVHVSGGSGSTKYGKIQVVRSWKAPSDEGHVTFISHLNESSLLLVTSRSTIAILDIRTMSIKHRWQHPLELGTITAFCPSQHWLVVGTELGILSLWDLRFGLLVKSWRTGGAITNCQIHPSRGKGKWIMCSIERVSEQVPLLEVYAIDDPKSPKLIEVYEARSDKPNKEHHYEIPSNMEIASRKELIAQIAEKASSGNEKKNIQELHSVLTTLVGSRFASLPQPEEGVSLLSSLSSPKSPSSSSASSSNQSGYLITAGEDRIIRYFDLSKNSDSMIICGSSKQKEVSFKSTNVNGVTVNYTIPESNLMEREVGKGNERQKLESVRETLGKQPLRPHYDAICALGSVETGVSSCIISGDRSGIVKVWRVEGGAK